MNGYVIKRTNGRGGYVANSGNKTSYTNIVNRIRVYPNKAVAERDRCVENEIVVPADTVFK